MSEGAVEQAARESTGRPSRATSAQGTLRRFFRQGDKYHIQKSVRDLCIFARQDLTRDPPFSKLDLIVCRNVLIDMGPSLQRRVLSIFQYALKPRAFMMLGSAETVGFHAEYFSVVGQAPPGLQQEGARAPREPVISHRVWRPCRTRTAGRGESEIRTGRGIHAEGDAATPRALRPASVLIDSDFQILQTRGRTGITSSSRREIPA